MRIFIRFEGKPVVERQLSQEQSYRVGRGTDCEICYPNPRVSRLQGTLSFREGQWEFADVGSVKGKTTVYLVTPENKVLLDNGLEILSEDYVGLELTMSSFPIKAAPSNDGISNLFARRPAVVLSTLAFAVLLGASVFLLQKRLSPMNAYSVLEFAKPRTVVFEMKRDEALTTTLIKVAGLSQADFRENFGYCTGFVVAPGVVMTANHCVFDQFGNQVAKDGIIRDGNLREHAVVRVLGFDPLHDFAVLEVPTLNDVDAFEFAKSSRTGDPVFTVGNVYGEGIAIRNGIVSGETEDPSNPEVKHLRFSAGASPGNSGGPVLNAHGQVIGLVSQKNESENYNIGVRAVDLQKGLADFAVNRENKRVHLTAKEMMSLKQPMYPALLAESMGIPIPGAGSYGENLEPFSDPSGFEVDVSVPAKAQEISDATNEGLSKWLQQLQEKQKEKALADGKPGMTWEEQVNKEVPLLVLLPGDDRHQLGVKKARVSFSNHGPIQLQPAVAYESLRNQAKDDAETDGPHFFHVENIYDGEFRPLTSDGWKKSQASLGYHIRSNEVELPGPRSLNMFGMRTSFPVQLVIDYEGEASDEKLASILKFWATSDGGAQVSLEQFPFLRPDKKSQFKIDELPEAFKITREVKDRAHRSWKVFSSDVFTLQTLNFACLDHERQSYCRLISPASATPDISEKTWQNIGNFTLSQMRSFLDFIPTEELKGSGNLAEKTGNPELQDFDWKEDAGHLQVTLKSVGKKFDIGSIADVHQVRFIPGLFYNEAAQVGEWKALAVETLGHVKNKYVNCTAGVDFTDYHFLAQTTQLITPKMAKRMRSLASVEDEPAQKQKPEKKVFFRAPANASFMGHQMETFGVCNQLTFDPEKSEFDYDPKLEPWRPPGL